MPREPFEYVKVDNKLPDHPKLDGLGPSTRVTLMGTLIEIWCYCDRLRTDGWISARKWRELASATGRRLALDLGFVEEVGDSYQVHDYLDRQRSRAEIAALSEVRRKAGSKGGFARANAMASATANATAPATAPAQAAATSNLSSKSVAEQSRASCPTGKTAPPTPSAAPAEPSPARDARPYRSAAGRPAPPRAAPSCPVCAKPHTLADCPVQAGHEPPRELPRPYVPLPTRDEVIRQVRQAATTTPDPDDDIPF